MAVSGGLLFGNRGKIQRTKDQNRPFWLATCPPSCFRFGRVCFLRRFRRVDRDNRQNPFSVSPFASGAITVVAALVMLALGLDMLKLLPKWIKKLTPTMPALFRAAS